MKTAYRVFLLTLILLLAPVWGGIRVRGSGSEEIFGAEETGDENWTDNGYEGYGGGYAVTGRLGKTGYLAKLYDASNGLPTSDANYVLCTRDGYIYIAGYSGIIRYDGSSFERLDASDGLTNGRVLFEDEGGRLWVGTNDNGVVALNGDKRKHYTYEDGLPSSSVRSFAQDKNGDIYIGTTSGICFIGSDDMVKRLEDTRISSSIIRYMSVDRAGRIYGSTDDGNVFCMENGRITSFYSSLELGTESVSAIFADPEKEDMVYIGTDSGSIYYGRFGQKTYRLKKINNTPEDGIYFITRQCGSIWATSKSRAGFIDENDNFNPILNVPMNNSVDMLTSDYQGNLWLASSRQGVMKVVTSNFKDLTGDAGLGLSSVNTTCVYRGILYSGTDDGLSAIDDNGKTVENELTSLLKDTRIRCISRDEKENLWVSTYTNDHGLVCMSPEGNITKYTTEEGMPDNRIRCTVNGKDGSLIVGTNGGLAVIKDGRVIRTAGASAQITNTVFLTVCEGDGGEIYAGTDGDGIYVIDGERTEKIGRDDGLTSDVILRIKKDEEAGVFWIITSNSIQYMKDGKLYNVDSFPYNNNFDIFRDASNDLWVLSSIGIYCVKAGEMLDNNVTDYKLYTMANGLAGAPTANSYSYCDGDGNLYFSERNGVCLVNINHFFEHEEKIKTGIRTVLFNDERILPDADGGYTLPASRGRIQIIPAILDYTMTDPMVNIYLEGTGDPGVSNVQSRLSALEYTNLSYGNYRMHIQTLDKTTGEVIQDDVFAITKKPVWTELMIVRILLLFAIIFTAGFIVWRVMRSTVVNRQVDEIKKARDEAERANTAKSRFLANMSHEIRTPINTIMGMNEMVLREDAKDVPKGYFVSIINYSLDIRNATESLLGLINDLLDMSKIESGKMHLVEQEYDVREMLRSVVSMIRARSTEKELSFDVVADELMPVRLYGDVGKIKQIVLNLLTNALKYTDRGGFCLNVSMEERNDDRASIRFSVKDTGMGVREEDLDKLFSAYERLDEVKNSNIQGTGLGLDISRKFALLMGGELKCESVYGEGSEFILTLDQRIVDDTPMGVFLEHDERSGSGPYVPRFIAPDADILVVDDNPMNLNVIKGLLKATRVFVTTSSSGGDALDKIRDSHFDVVLLDHMMPGMDGIETVEKIREIYPELPVYALTANSTAGEDFYLSKGFNGYLSKPVDSRALEETIMRHLPEEMMEKPTVEDAVRELEKLPEDLMWLYETEGISVDDGVRFSGGISNFIFSLNLFLDTMDENLNVIRGAYDSGDLRLYTIKVHALKSSARIIGAGKLSLLAERLEDAGNRKDRDFIAENTAELTEEYESYRERLSGLKKAQNAKDDAREIPEDELKDAYEALGDVIPQMDYDAVEMILGQVLGYKLPKDDEERFLKLSDCLKKLDWDGMEEVLGI